MSKTIVEKLNLNKYEKAAILREPEGESLFEGLAAYDTELAEGAGYDLIFAFALDMGELQAVVRKVIEGGHLNKNGYLYAAYPKKGNKAYPTFIHRDELFAGLDAGEDGYIGKSDFKFARMAGLNEVFTVVGFKEEARKAQVSASAKPSQRTNDYVDRVADVERDLRDRPAALDFYRSLTPGYRKDWARFVYGVVQENTRERRREEMIAMLEAGYKSVDSYRRR
ncbi:Bacteriocin-protection, YdeI or OmpD-Associated [Cohnella sp. OV330]|uniref:YdeI/OmpD-associated family protein n=1 Tax=Cohnella sp. OV330 TaxID=1855288 RepID=UPI0008E97B94|nr:YdeI/OmpD-associated family protein [Cohnella sp. OV330]SFB49306.1 Bacteriocin-protection, YdeI or OmpD-Associated [Cohnella sp. OV330]